jgi:hypothetical protein
MNPLTRNSMNWLDAQGSSHSPVPAPRMRESMRQRLLGWQALQHCRERDLLFFVLADRAILQPADQIPVG